MEKGTFTKLKNFRFSVLKKLYMLPHVYSNFRRSINVAIKEVDDMYLVSLKIIILDYIWFCL